jgi:hypothetical protein
MKKGFVLACLVAFAVQYEKFNHIIVMLIVGKFDLGQAWANAFKHFSVSSAFFIGCFRLIPFLILAIVALRTNLSTDFKGKATLIVGFVVTNTVIFLGYWSVTEPLYTDAHTPSTSAITYIWAPITATLYSAFAGFLMYLSLWLSEKMLKRAY